MAMNVRESIGGTFDEVMQKTALEVLTLATYLIDKIKLLELRHASKHK